MRPTLSELGSYDGTALMEFKSRKNIVYLLHESNVCTYEMDDTPPFLINSKALDIAIEQCLMLGCDIIDEVHIARKQYLDGSIPTGFQRTAIVGVNGRLPFRGRELTITQVSVEEDSCREVSDRGHLIVWRTDRLGMPLIETVTGPELHTPDEVADAILLIGRVCRSTLHVRTGIGASRQDVNVSVRGGRRVEIKGVPKAGWAPALVHGEAVRQVNLLRLADDLHHRGFVAASDLEIEHRAVTALVADHPSPLLRADGWAERVAADDRRQGLELGEGDFTVRAVRLRRLAGTLSWPTQPGRVFADELRGRVRVIAGLDQPPILISSEDPQLDAADAEAVGRISKALHCDPDDAIVVVWGPDRDTETAVEEIRLRYVDAIDGVPHETRQPFEDGSTDFERILPGPDRMYPDTDLPPQAITRERVAQLVTGLPEAPWSRESRYAAAGVPTPVIHWLIRRGHARLVDLVVEETGTDLKRPCFFYGARARGWRRAGLDLDAIGDRHWIDLFRLFESCPVAWEARDRLVGWMAEGPDESPTAIAVRHGIGVSPDDWRSRLAEVAANARPDGRDQSVERRRRFVLGRVLSELRGRVPVSDVESAVRDAVMSLEVAQ
jgi:glutamyl-tRNA(Gln) amidotransferase subunit E